MKKITVMIGTILAMVVIMIFPCYGKEIPACYQKNNGQLRILTDHKDACRPSEIPITLGGAEGAEVPTICAGYVDGENCTAPTGSTGPIPCPFTSSCVSNVERLDVGQYNITFTTGFNKPICVLYFYTWPKVGNVLLSTYTPGIYNSGDILVIVSVLEEYFDLPFNFICTEP